jgi:hypothetical protein
MKLTNWFPPEVKPVRKGVYDIAKGVFSAPWFGYWNGKKWVSVGNTPYKAMEHPYAAWDDFPAIRQDFEWRGLARKPK